MALITMAVYATQENQKTDIARRTFEGLIATVNPKKHRVIVVDNGSCPAAQVMFKDFYRHFKFIHTGENLGTAGAVNIAWLYRKPGECVVKMDDDCLIHDADWCDQLEQCIEADPKIGIIGLKRIDLLESPDLPEGHPFKSYLYDIELASGDVATIELVNHVMGTCQMYNPALLDKIGYLYQPRLYGFDDSLAAVRCKAAGFKSCFLPHIRIDHIDPGDTPFQTWKHKVSGEDMPEYNRLKTGYENGTIPIYYNPYQ